MRETAAVAGGVPDRSKEDSLSLRGPQALFTRLHILAYKGARAVQAQFRREWPLPLGTPRQADFVHPDELD